MSGEAIPTGAVSGLDPDQRQLWTDSVAMARAYAAAVQGDDVIAARADPWVA